MLQADGVQPVLVEQHLAAIGGRHVERLHHDDGVGRADLHAQLAELAGVELEGEGLGVVALLALQHLDLDHRRRADELAQPAADAGFLAGLRVVDERQQAAIAIGIRALLVRIVHGHRLAEQVEERDPHRLRDGAMTNSGLVSRRRLASDRPRPLESTGPPDDHDRRRDEQQQRGRQQQLPRQRRI